MTVSARYSENYGDPNAEVQRWGVAVGLAPAPADFSGPRDGLSFLTTIQPEGQHGLAFSYKSPNAEVLSWIVQRVSGKSLAALLSDAIWSKIGAEKDAYLVVDSSGTESGAIGLSATLRDLARFTEMLRNKGRLGSTQVLPAAAVDELLMPADKTAQEVFAKANYPTLAGWSYHDQWWFTNNEHHAFAGRGIFGQGIYVDPVAEMVIVRYASMPTASSSASDPLVLPFYSAVAEALMKGQ
jgi:CubicO group peptidase (beta-lactamase class C family)